MSGIHPMGVASLRWLERACMAAGITLGVWCIETVVEQRYFQTLPVPAATGLAATRAIPPNEPTAEEGQVASHPIGAGTWLARLDAPTVHLSATVLEGSDTGTLARAAGHIEDTALPGEPGNVGIAGHRDTVFRAVRRLRVGDPLTLTTADRRFQYRITSLMIVDPTEVSVLDPTGHPTMTLVTCYPFAFVGPAPRRFIVRADLVEIESRRSTA
jgi:sortase A